MTDEEKKIEVVEGIQVRERNIQLRKVDMQIAGVDYDDYVAFIHYCREFCKGRYDLGIKNLLEVARMDTKRCLFEFDERLKAIELKISEPKKEEIPEPKIKTFGAKGGKNE